MTMFDMSVLQASSEKVSEQVAAAALHIKGSMASGSNEYISSKGAYFVVDSGAHRHIVGSRDMLLNVKAADVSSIQYGGEGMMGTVKCMGDVLLVLPSVSSGRSRIEVLLKDVLVVPEVVCNIISVPRITSVGNTVLFGSSSAHMFSPDGEVFAVAERCGNLYGMAGVVAGSSVVQEASCLAALPAAVKQGRLWHKRLGHASYKAAAAEACDVCLKGKATRLPFPDVQHGVVAPLERLHCDVLYVRASDCVADFGYSTKGVMYVSTVLDQGTGVSLVSMMPSKGHAIAHVIQSVAYLENQVKGKYTVKAIRFDRGGEYMSSKLQKWCADKGISVEPTAPYSPQSNGRAERLNRTLLNSTRCLLLESGLSNVFWCEALAMANWLRNRLLYSPTGMSPYEALLGVKPDISKAHVFGSPVVFTVAKQLRDSKLDPPGQGGRFLGFDGGAYKVLPDGAAVGPPGKQPVVLSRDVRFLESGVLAQAGSDADDYDIITGPLSSGSTAPVGVQQPRLAAGQPAAGGPGGAGGSGAGGSGAGGSGAGGADVDRGGGMSPAVRLPVQRLANLPGSVVEAPPVQAGASDMANAPAQGGRSVRAGRGVNPKYGGDVWQLSCTDGELVDGCARLNPTSTFISFR
jgi:transposase InsO family protein